jgi:hypothetical protein
MKVEINKKILCNTAIAEGVPGCFLDTNQRFSAGIDGDAPTLRTKCVRLQFVTHHARAAIRNGDGKRYAKLCDLGGTLMLDPKTLEDFGAKMSALLANSPAKDIEKNAKAVMSGLLGKLDLVTREEFDVQAEVLARTRQKLKELEARVDALEKARQA